MSTPDHAPPSEVSAPTTASTTASAPTHLSLRKNGKSWHSSSSRPRFAPGSTSHVSSAPSSTYAKRAAATAELKALKAREADMKAEKAASRAQWIGGIKERRAKKEEKARYEKMAATMHAKRVERKRRREGRNKKLGK